jgi:hypothetical protein
MTFESTMAEARQCLDRGDEKSAGRLMLEAVELARTPEQCTELETVATEAARTAGFLRKGRFTNAADLARKRREAATVGV